MTPSTQVARGREAASLHVVFDGRVYATEASDRGMGRYVDFLIQLAGEAGHRVTVIRPDVFPVGRRHAGATERACLLEEDPLAGTTTLNRYLRDAAADVYVDATPFLPPMRYDVHACPVVAVLYDLIPMRFPTAYFGSADAYPLDVYVNGLARVRKADQVISISRYVAGHALRYLGIARDRIAVIEPTVGEEYVEYARAHPKEAPGTTRSRDDGERIVAIQGAHRSKNFPAAIPFLERLSASAPCDVDIIAPTRTQHGLIDEIRDPRASRVRVHQALPEHEKFTLQREARVVAHLSIDEGYGIPLAEALYLNRPIICLDTPINRELIGDADPASEAGVFLIDDPRLESTAVVRDAVQFFRDAGTAEIAPARARIVATLVGRRERAGATLAQALSGARGSFDRWRSRSGMAIVAPTEFGICGVSDYCHALMRDGQPRYGLILGRASRALQMTPGLRLLPVALLDDVRSEIRGALFNLAVSDSLVRAFDAIAERSAPEDVLVVHDAGSYIPGLMMQAAASHDDRLLFDRYLADESSEVQALARRWLSDPSADPSHAGPVFLEIDRNTRSTWLRHFRGRIVSHHPAFAGRASSSPGVLALLLEDSQIRTRAMYVPMPFDPRARPGAQRMASRIRWALGVARHDVLVCCAGSVVGGKHLDAVARVVARLDADPSVNGAPALTLLLAGRVLDDGLFARMRDEFAACRQPERLVTIVEGDEARYDALLLASDVVIAFREQRRIQMSHSYVRALALGRPLITNGGAGFDDEGAALVCGDDDLEHDLARHLSAVRDSIALRRQLGRQSLAVYRARHTVDEFFGALTKPGDVAAAF